MYASFHTSLDVGLSHPPTLLLPLPACSLSQSSATPTRRVVVVEGTEFVLDPRFEVIRYVRGGACCA